MHKARQLSRRRFLAAATRVSGATAITMGCPPESRERWSAFGKLYLPIASAVGAFQLPVKPRLRRGFHPASAGGPHGESRDLRRDCVLHCLRRERRLVRATASTGYPFVQRRWHARGELNRGPSQREAQTDDGLYHDESSLAWQGCRPIPPKIPIPSSIGATRSAARSARGAREAHFPMPFGRPDVAMRRRCARGGGAPGPGQPGCEIRLLTGS